MIMNPAFLTSDVAHVLLISALLAFFLSHTLGRYWNRHHAGLLGAAIGAIVAIAPWPWQPIFYTRGILGDQGALGWFFSAHLLVHSIYRKPLLSDFELHSLSLAALLGALLIYPAATGLTGWPDFYNAGFASYVPPIGSAVLAAFFLWRNSLVAAACMGLGLFLYGLDLHESTNLWDCYLDTPSVCVSILILEIWAWRSWRRRRELISPRVAA